MPSKTQVRIQTRPQPAGRLFLYEHQVGSIVTPGREPEIHSCLAVTLACGAVLPALECGACEQATMSLRIRKQLAQAVYQGQVVQAAWYRPARWPGPFCPTGQLPDDTLRWLVGGGLLFSTLADLDWTNVADTFEPPQGVEGWHEQMNVLWGDAWRDYWHPEGSPPADPTHLDLSEEGN